MSQGLHLITKLRKKMHNRLLDWSDKLLLRKHAIIETITDQLKNISETRAFPPSQPDQLSGQPGRRAHYSSAGLAYPELTLVTFTFCTLIIFCHIINSKHIRYSLSQIAHYFPPHCRFLNVLLDVWLRITYTIYTPTRGVWVSRPVKKKVIRYGFRNKASYRRTCNSVSDQD